MILIVGIGITITLATVVVRANHTNERRLLTLQTQLTASAIAAAEPLYVEDHLGGAARLATVTHGDPATFQGALQGSVTAKGPFVSASLWRVTGNTPQQVTTLGTPPLVSPMSARGVALLRLALASKSFAVTEIVSHGQLRLGCAIAARGPRGTFVAYAEAPLPPSRRVPPSSGSPTSQLNFALYLGHRQTASSLLVADAAASLPLRGTTVTSTIPFGDTVLTLTASPASPLDGEVAAVLPWVIAIAGPLLTLIAALMAGRLLRGREKAERLSREVEHLYVQQRSVSETLQQAILPRQMPAIPGMEIAGLYLPGVAGVDVGGDWYDVVPLDGSRFAFVVGDVSGRGIGAAAVMASLHYASRAYALEGHTPTEVLERLSRTLNIEQDGHMATVLCGMVDVRAHQITLASAGHLPPVLCGDGQSSLVTLTPGVPIGVLGHPHFTPATLSADAHGTLIAYTDGLVERRGESLDTGMNRLREAAVRDSTSVEELLSGIVTDLTKDSPNDDIALIGLRWLN